MLRIALLFGSAAVALALILAPLADRYSKSQIVGLDGLDFTATGSIGDRAALHDPPQRAAGTRLRLHHPRQRPAQRRLLTSSTRFTLRKVA